ncbi:MAG: hypothetical protein R3E97_19885 [Candidatus Eisenbacteria bacterium]
MRDGGSLRLEAVCSSGDTLRFFVDNRMNLSERERGQIYLGQGPDGRPIRHNSEAEREVLRELRSWMDRNFEKDGSGQVVGVSGEATDPSPTLGEFRTLVGGLPQLKEAS